MRIRFSLVLIVISMFILTCGCDENGKQKGEERQGSAKQANRVLDEFDNWQLEDQPWKNVEIILPSGMGTLIFYRRHAHPFLAEYDRKVTLESADRRSAFDLLPNCGGQTNVNIYLVTMQDELTLDDNRTIWLHDQNDPGSAYVIGVDNLGFRIEGERRYWSPSKPGGPGNSSVIIPTNAVLLGTIMASKEGSGLQFVAVNQ